MTLYTKVLNLFNSMNEQELIEVHNEYCDYYNMQSDCIYSRDEIVEVLENCESVQLENGFNIQDQYFFFNGYERLESTNNLKCTGLDIREIAENIAIDENGLNNERIQKSIDEWNQTKTESEGL